MNKNIELNAQISEAIKTYVEEKRKELFEKGFFVNTLLREDVLDLLDKYCNVVYYPLEHDNNNGFHVKGIIDSQKKEEHFVFINTAQTIEKQVFTAAHELGHAWEVDKIIAQECQIELNEDIREKIINRFAAELLMPEKEFKNVYQAQIEKYKGENNLVKIIDLLRVITFLMNHFFSPFKAVIRRLNELKCISQKTQELLLGELDIDLSVIKAACKLIIDQEGYIKFKKPTNKKWIDGLAEMLDEAEIKKSVPSDKIENLRKKFDITKASSNEQIEKAIKE